MKKIRKDLSRTSEREKLWRTSEREILLRGITHNRRKHLNATPHTYTHTPHRCTLIIQNVLQPWT